MSALHSKIQAVEGQHGPHARAPGAINVWKRTGVGRYSRSVEAFKRKGHASAPARCHTELAARTKQAFARIGHNK